MTAMKKKLLMTNNELITIREFEYLCVTKPEGRNGFHQIKAKPFKALKNFVLENRREDNGDLNELLAFTSKKGIGECVQARNYVGVISLQDGPTIEILPKIDATGTEDTEQEKQCLLNMLQALLHIPLRTSGNARLAVSQLNIFETFIAMFLEEAKDLIKRGLRSDYSPIESNEHFLKGRLLFSQNIRHNAAHQERFYVCYDEYSLNRAENRILKSTLTLLARESKDSKNRKAIKLALSILVDVPLSKNIDADLAKCRNDRTTTSYQAIIAWCEIFLKGESFSTFKGSSVAVALLFPMEKLFEAYVAQQIKHAFSSEWAVRTQEGSRYLYDNSGKGLLKPDIICRRKSNASHIAVLDTKWKRIKSGSDISQADLYQMYAYHRKFDALETMLIYPASKDAPFSEEPFAQYKADDASLTVFMYDLSSPEAEKISLENLKRVLLKAKEH